MNDRDRLALIGSIYEAIGEHDAVSHVMSNLSVHLGATVAFWYVIRKGVTGGATSSPFLFDGVIGVGARTLQEFRDEMWRHDFALRAASVTDRTTETHELISEGDLARNDFAQWLKVSAGVERRIGRSTDLSGGVAAGWSFHMPNGLRCSERERREFDTLAPHVRNFFRLTSQFGEAGAQRAALEQVVDARGHAVVLLALDGTVCWASETALALFARNDGLDCCGGRLSFARPQEKRAFEALLQQAATRYELTSSVILSRLAIARPSGASPYVLEISPAPGQFRRNMNDRGAFVLTVYDAEATIDPRPELWREMFGLTHMEARVATMTMRGLPDATIAAQLGIGIGTVRTHQKQLLAKTETRSKAEVAHLLTLLS